MLPSTLYDHHRTRGDEPRDYIDPDRALSDAYAATIADDVPHLVDLIERAAKGEDVRVAAATLVADAKAAGREAERAAREKNGTN